MCSGCTGSSKTAKNAGMHSPPKKNVYHPAYSQTKKSSNGTKKNHQVVSTQFGKPRVSGNHFTIGRKR